MFSCKHKNHRFDFSVKMFNEIQQIKNIDSIKFVVHAQEEVIQAWYHHLSTYGTNIDVSLAQYPSQRYLDRVYSAQSSECKYSCKLDDDVLISRHVWDYMIENLDKITNETPIIAPILTNGIPTVDLFIEDFLSEEDLKIAHDLLLKGRITENQWGLDYSKVNEKIENMVQWNGREFWDFMDVVDTGHERLPVPWSYFSVRGVHPARYSKEFNLFIARKVAENKEKFFGKNDYRLETYKAPYFTNNLFIAETEYWKNTTPLHNDGWDEGQLTLRMLMDESSVLYVRNGFGIHMAYGMTEGQREIEREYTEKL